jgi:type II secretory pathway pseudopilin PulG
VTLIEVLAALSLLGSLAVTMVLSRGRLMEQHHRAEQKLEAVRVADGLLAEWWAEDLAGFPIDADGAVSTHENWSWETHIVANRELDPFNARVVRLRILDNENVGEPVELTSVDVVLPEGGSR